MKPTNNCNHSNTQLLHLVGLARNIVLFIHEKCRASYNMTTAELSIEDIALSCSTTKMSVKKTIQRLERKQLLIRAEFKSGRSGWTKYRLSESIHQEILDLDNNAKKTI